MIKRLKKVLILIDAATTGATLQSAIGSVKFYGGKTIGFSSIFSVSDHIGSTPIRALYSLTDLPDYILTQRRKNEKKI